MTCEQAITLIHLNRPGERSEQDDRLLESHVRTCVSCTAEAELVRTTAERMDRLVHAPAPTVHLAHETRRIMDAVREESTARWSILDVLVRAAQRRTMRFAYVGLSLGAILLMVVQLSPQRTDSNTVTARTGPYLTYTVDTGSLTQLTDLPLPKAMTAPLLAGPTLEVRKADVERSSRLIGQAMLRSLSLSEDQRRHAESVIASLGRSPAISFRFGKIGG